MRKLVVLALAITLLPLAAHAQQANLTQTQTIAVPTGATTNATATHMIVMSVDEDRDSAAATIVVALRDAGGNVLRRITVTIPDANGACPSATLQGYFQARSAARSGELGGGNSRTQNFRVLGYLSDQGCLPAASTLVP